MSFSSIAAGAPFIFTRSNEFTHAHAHIQTQALMTVSLALWFRCHVIECNVSGLWL